MLNARIELAGTALRCSDLDRPGAKSSLKPLPPDRLERLRRWAADYDRAVRADQPASLPAIGRDIAALLDDGDGWLESCLRESTGDIALEIRVPADPADPDEQALAAALLDVPWELLTSPGRTGPALLLDFLALDDARLFRVARRIGPPPPDTPRPAPAAPGDLTLLFMAAEVEGQDSLDYEREEAAILDATAGLDRLNLLVEESGGVAGLHDRLAQAGAVEALHITAHGDIRDGEPFLALEAPDGTLDPVGVGKLRAALGAEERCPRLLVLSACRTAEDAGAAGSLIRRMVVGGIPNALGWDGSVYDTDATRFAAAFYGELSAGHTVAGAAALARRSLLQAHAADPNTGSHWHLARVYLGPDGGAPLCDPQADRREFDNDAGIAEFLDRKGERVPVATAAQFVGRRRQIQRTLRALGSARTHAAPAGVLVHGLGGAGKSSLAARVANRMRDHRTVVLVDRYDPDAVLYELEQALAPDQRAQFRAGWAARVAQDPDLLKDALESLLKGPFSGRPGTQKILLVIDDLEQRLKHPEPGEAATPFRTALDKTVFGAIIAAFRDARTTASRLLVTSRYTFALTDRRGRDLAACLATVPVPPLDEVQRRKQMRAAARLVGRDAPPASGDELESRILQAAGGNPGLQRDLAAPLLAGDLAAAEREVATVERYLRTGEIPADTATAAEFFRRVRPEEFRAMLTGAETTQLRAATLFTLPVPLPVLEAAGTAAGIADPAAALARLQGLGLLDRVEAPGAAAEAACNPLVRPLVPALTEADAATLAAAAIGPLAAAWTRKDGDLPWDYRGLETARLALLGKAPSDILTRAAHAGGRFLFHAAHDARSALGLVRSALAASDDRKAAPSLHLLLLGTQCADRLGEATLLDALLDRALATPTDDLSTHAMLLAQAAERRRQAGNPAEAERLLGEAKAHFEKLGDVRSRAVTMGKIADIFQACGEHEEALRIRREEELPVYERLGDVYSRAVTMGRIADILQGRGEHEEALRIRREEQLPVYERLGDVRSRAVTMGRIADILQGRGEHEEALRIRREEELPVYERLGDVRSRAVTMGQIADILQGRGEHEEALRIRREEELPVYERLGDVYSRAVTMGKIADILQGRGEHEEALRIRREEQLPVYERLGDVYSRAVTMGKIADILQGRGEHEEALRIRREEQLPVYERLGDVRSRAVTMGRIADILQGRGEHEEALRIRREEALPVYDRLGDVRERAVTMGKIADILQARGEHEEALRIRREEALPVYDRLGDVRSRAVTMGGIADILQARGELDEALRIRREEQLPVYDRLGAVRERAVTMGKIADILQARGELDEALRIRREEQLPVYDRLGDVRSRAVTMGKIADILQARGELDEVLRIRREEELPVYGRLGAVRSRAVTMGKIADILQARGELDEALRIRREEVLPIFRQMGDIHSVAYILHQCAILRIERGVSDQEDWKIIADEFAESFAISRHLGQADFLAEIGFHFGQFLSASGNREAALTVLDEAVAAAEKLRWQDRVAEIRQLQEKIRGSGG